MKHLLLVFLLLGLQVGCGYQVLRGDTVLGHSQLAIAAIHEPTVIGITSTLTRHLHTELLKQGLTLVEDDPSAPLRLVIQLKDPKTTTTVISSVDAAVPVYQESLTLIASLQDPSTGTTHWTTRLAQDELFKQEADETGDTALLTEAGRKRALDRLARRFALELSGRLLVASLSTHEAN